MNDSRKVTKQNLRNIKTRDEYEALKKKYLLSGEEQQILDLMIVENKNLSYIGDILGYSERTILIQKDNTHICGCYFFCVFITL